jgi:hypothetical protein
MANLGFLFFQNKQTCVHFLFKTFFNENSYYFRLQNYQPHLYSRHVGTFTCTVSFEKIGESSCYMSSLYRHLS